jgi:ABC-type multidrug transport system ATPase subunit
MIKARHLTKRYDKAVAVDDVSFVVQPGRVTGFLGPNAAGKPVTMRMILSLDTPSSGSVLINSKPPGGTPTLSGQLERCSTPRPSSAATAPPPSHVAGWHRDA